MQPPPEINEQKLLTSLLDILSSGWVSSNHFERLVNELTIPDGPPSIYFLTGIQQVLRELPFKAYADDNSRMAILDAAQSALDQAIAREETREDAARSSENKPANPNTH